MFSSDQNISSLKDLIVEVKEYIGMRYELAKLDLISKFTILIASLFLCVVLMFLLGVALLFLSYSAAKGIAGYFGSESIAFLVISCVYLVIAFLVYHFRKRLIVRPIAKFLSKLFLEPVNKKEEKNETVDTI